MTGQSHITSPEAFPYPWVILSFRAVTLSSLESQPLLLLWAESSPHFTAPSTDSFPSGTCRPLWLPVLSGVTAAFGKAFHREESIFSSLMMFCWHLPKPNHHKQQCQVWGRGNPSHHSAGTGSLSGCLVTVEQVPFKAWDDSPSLTPPHSHEWLEHCFSKKTYKLQIVGQRK